MDVLREIVGVEEVLVALQSLLSIEKGTSPSDFKPNEHFFEMSITSPSIQSALV